MDGKGLFVACGDMVLLYGVRSKVLYCIRTAARYCNYWYCNLMRGDIEAFFDLIGNRKIFQNASIDRTSLTIVSAPSKIIPLSILFKDYSVCTPYAAIPSPGVPYCGGYLKGIGTCTWYVLVVLWWVMTRH